MRSLEDQDYPEVSRGPGLGPGLPKAGSEPVAPGHSLEQRVHVQQVVLDRRAGHRPAGPGPQPTDRHGGLHLGVLDVVGLVQDQPGPAHLEQRARA